MPLAGKLSCRKAYGATVYICMYVCGECHQTHIESLVNKKTAGIFYFGTLDVLILIQINNQDKLISTVYSLT